MKQGESKTRGISGADGMRRLVLGTVAAAVAATACGRSGDLEIVEGILVNRRIVDATANVGFDADLDINPNSGAPAIAYYDFTNGDLKFARLNNNTGEWNHEVVDDIGDVGGFADVEHTATGTPHIAYYDYSNQKIKYAVQNELGEWELQTVDDIPGAVEGFLSMALDRNEVAYIAFISAGRLNLNYIAFDPEAGVGAGNVIDDGTLTSGRGGNINMHVSMALRTVRDASVPVVAYYQGSHGLLQMAWLPEGESSFRVRVLDGALRPGANDVGQWVSTAIEATATTSDANHRLHLSYYDATEQNLKYARYDWARDEVLKEIVDREGIVGEHSSIALKREGPPEGDEEVRPAISYYDSTNNDLKVALRGRSDRLSAADADPWRPQVVDIRGIVGSFSSLQLLRDGKLGVAYRDNGREALKFAVVQTN